MKINSKTKLICILGHPVEHSLSPVIHNPAFEMKELNIVYLAFDIQNLENAINGLKEIGFIGASVTVPYKEKIIQYIDEIEEKAKSIGTINTIVNKENRLYGYNTDIIGIEKSLRKINLNNSNVIIIGAGGTSRSVITAISSLGKNINIHLLYNRDKDKKNRLLNEFKKYDNINMYSLDDESIISESKLIVNCTPVGMNPNINATPIDTNLINKNATVFDVIYTPYKTRLLIEAEKKGCNIIPGFNMFLYQAIAQFELWTNINAPEKIMRKILKEYLL